jgi:hypothetical protein
MGISRRKPLTLPYVDQVPQLAPFLRDDGGEPPAPIAAERLVDAALHHRVAGYLVRALKSGRLELPVRQRHRLEGSAAGSIVHAAVLRNELAEVAAVLGDACGSAPLVIKGAAVAELYYPDRRLRPYFDLDLLVAHEHLETGAAALEARGYERLEEFRPGYADRFGHDIRLRRRVAGRWADVELHWRVGDDPVGASLSHSRLGRDAQRVEIDGATLAVPAASGHLLVLAMHLLSDREKRLCWVHDVALVASSLDDAAWPETFALADELGLGWPLHRALDYAERHLAFERPRPRAVGPPPRWGPLRAVEELNLRASPHLGRLAILGWRDRLSFLRAVMLPTRAGLAGTVGEDGDDAGSWRLAGRHVRRALAGLAPRREPRERRRGRP